PSSDQHKGRFEQYCRHTVVLSPVRYLFDRPSGVDRIVDVRFGDLLHDRWLGSHDILLSIWRTSFRQQVDGSPGNRSGTELLEQWNGSRQLCDFNLFGKGTIHSRICEGRETGSAASKLEDQARPRDTWHIHRFDDPRERSYDNGSN